MYPDASVVLRVRGTNEYFMHPLSGVISYDESSLSSS